MGMLKEFKEFAMKGNVVDLAVAVVIGGAFGKIVTSFVNDIIMPPIGLLLGGVDFSKLKFVLKAAEGDVQAVTLNYGAWINTVIDFLIVALVIFMVIKALSSLKKKEALPDPIPAPPPIPTKEETLLTEIRDLLAKK
jgi:large conductance mechanosensitive channel